MIEIKKLAELSENEGFKILIGSTAFTENIDAFYPELLPDFGPDDPDFHDKYFKFLDNKKNLIKQIKLLERVKKEIILVYIDDKIVISALKEYLDYKTRIVRTSIDRTHG